MTDKAQKNWTTKIFLSDLWIETEPENANDFHCFYLPEKAYYPENGLERRIQDI